MDFRTFSHDDLIEYCVKNNINYMTKLKKPMAKRTLLTLLTKLPELIVNKKQENITLKPIITDNKIKELQKIKQEEIKEFKERKTIEIKEIIDEPKETNEIKFGDLFDLVKSNLNNSNITYDEKGVTFITNDSKNKKIKALNIMEVKVTSGFNIFIGLTSNANKFPIKYYESQCYYSNSMALCKLKDGYNDKINLKYIYHYLIYKKKYIETTYLRGLTNKSLDTYIFNFMSIPIPSVDKQNEIIKDIEDLDTIINSKKVLIKNLQYEQEIYNKHLNLHLNKNYEYKLLSDLCVFLPRSLLKQTQGEKEGVYPFFNNPDNINSYVYTNDYKIESLIIVENIENKPNIYYCTEFSAANNCLILQNKDNTIVNLKYIYNYLLLNKKYIIDFDNIQNIKIPIPIIHKQNELIIEIEKYNENKEKTLKTLETNIKDTVNIKNYLF